MGRGTTTDFLTLVDQHIMDAGGIASGLIWPNIYPSSYFMHDQVALSRTFIFLSLHNIYSQAMESKTAERMSVKCECPLYLMFGVIQYESVCKI